MGIQNITHRVNNFSLNNPDPPAKKAIRQTPSERSMPPFNEKSLKQPIPQFLQYALFIQMNVLQKNGLIAN